MADDQASNFHTEVMARLSNIGAVAHENFVKVTHFSDVDYMEGKRMVGLTEAVGVREVASKSVPAGPKSD